MAARRRAYPRGHGNRLSLPIKLTPSSLLSGIILIPPPQATPGSQTAGRGRLPPLRQLRPPPLPGRIRRNHGLPRFFSFSNSFTMTPPIRSNTQFSSRSTGCESPLRASAGVPRVSSPPAIPFLPPTMASTGRTAAIPWSLRWPHLPERRRRSPVQVAGVFAPFGQRRETTGMTRSNLTVGPRGPLSVTQATPAHPQVETDFWSTSSTWQITRAADRLGRPSSSRTK